MNRVAYFSPFPPQQTGVATYSAHLVEALTHKCELTLFAPGDADDVAGRPVINFVKHPECVTALNPRDVPIYNLGNNPDFHLDIYRTLLRQPGIVVLHDTVLYFMAAGAGRGGLYKELKLNGSLDAAGDLREIISKSIERNVLRYPVPEKFPLLARTLKAATSLIVHSQTSADALRRAGFAKPIHVIPHLTYPRSATAPSELARTRRELGIASDEVVIGSLGFGGRTKRMESIVRALAQVKHRAFRFLLVGAGNEFILPMLKRHGLQDRTVHVGYARDFSRLLEVCDLIVNLRFPSMGETSGTVIQAMQLAKPCIVTNDAWFSELPNDAVIKVTHSRGEIEETARALESLLESRPTRESLGARAQQFVDAHFAPARVATLYAEAIEASAITRAVSHEWLASHANARIGF